MTDREKTVINMAMPDCCGDCPILDDSGDYPYCPVLQEIRGYTFDIRSKRFPNCPLEEQEPVPLIHSAGYEEYWDVENICPKCNAHWISLTEDHFCPHCGQAVKDDG